MSPISLIVYICSPHEYRLNTIDLISINHIIRIIMMSTLFFLGTGYEYDRYAFAARAPQARRAEAVTNDQPASGHGPPFRGNQSRTASIQRPRTRRIPALPNTLLSDTHHCDTIKFKEKKHT